MYGSAGEVNPIGGGTVVQLEPHAKPHVFLPAAQKATSGREHLSSALEQRVAS